MFIIININNNLYKLFRPLQQIKLMTTITIARGDGIGPEIMEATLSILHAAGARIITEEVQIGEKIYQAGNLSGITQDAWQTIRRNKVFLKAPVTTPQGGGYKSLNVSARKFLGLYANVRPNISYHPFVDTKHPNMDVVIIRENEEDLYAGIEHQQTDEVVQCLKLISRPGCEKIIRYAFEFARSYGRKKVSCFTKDNIMKQTDGLFHQVFREIAEEYKDIISEHWIIDIGAAKLADTPEEFDVVVTPNLYGDVLSDIAAQIAGSVGLAGSANIGEQCAMFEAIHGSAPLLKGQDAANPSGLIQAAVLMLNHIGQSDIASRVQNAWLTTIEEGIHTFDIFKAGVSRECVGTKAFAQSVISNLGRSPQHLSTVHFTGTQKINLPEYIRKNKKHKKLVGMDLFVHWSGKDAEQLATQIKDIEKNNLRLTMITNRGIKVWPDGFSETFCTDHWRCRFLSTDHVELNKNEIIEIMQKSSEKKIDFIKSENLYEFDGVPGF